VHAYGMGADRVWVFSPPAGRPVRGVVLFIHGLGDQAETTPVHHRPWLEHLALGGDVVLYPQYELQPGGQDALLHIIRAVRKAKPHLHARGARWGVIGYSRGGRLAVDYASATPFVALESPRAVLSVFPSRTLDPVVSPKRLKPGTRIVILVGDRDTDVGTVGATELNRILHDSPLPRGAFHTEVVRSRAGFSATHLSVLETSAGARRAFWARADRLLRSSI
jgi:dienelactone hydrolase